MIRILIVDDQRLVRQGLRVLLDRVPDIEVVGEARDGLEAIVLCRKLNPDVVTMDIQMPNLDGLRAAERIKALGGKTEVVVVSLSSAASDVEQAMQKGAKGFVAKSEVYEELVPAIRTVCRGGKYLSQMILRTSMRTKAPPDRPDHYQQP